MTNLQKKASNLISDVLKLELGVRDIVKEIHRPEPKIEILGILEYQVLLIKGNSVCVESSALQSGIQWFDLKNVKLRQRNITLLMVLEATNIKKKELLIDQEGKMIQWEWNGIKDILKVKAVWQFRKDGKDLSLFDQKNETVKFIIKVLGEK